MDKRLVEAGYVIEEPDTQSGNPQKFLLTNKNSNSLHASRSTREAIEGFALDRLTNSYKLYNGKVLLDHVYVYELPGATREEQAKHARAFYDNLLEARDNRYTFTFRGIGGAMSAKEYLDYHRERLNSKLDDMKVVGPGMFLEEEEEEEEVTQYSSEVSKQFKKLHGHVTLNDLAAKVTGSASSLQAATAVRQSRPSHQHPEDITKEINDLLVLLHVLVPRVCNADLSKAVSEAAEAFLKK